MTAIEQLKDWWKREPRPEYAYQVVGDTIDARAILELADTVRLLEADVRELARRLDEKEPYPVTGTYKAQVDDFHVIEQKLRADQPDATDGDSNETGHNIQTFRTVGEMHKQLGTGVEKHSAPLNWNEPLEAHATPAHPCRNVFTFSDGDRLIVMDIGVTQLEMRVAPDGRLRRKLGAWPFGATGPVHRIRNVAQPEPRRERRTVRLAFTEDGDIITTLTTTNISDVVAIVEREIEFTHGEGLVGDAS